MTELAPENRDALTRVNGEALAWLKDRQANAPDDMEKMDAYALRYSIGRYEVGLEHYGEVLAKVGFAGKRRGLDVGSGAGHWVQAFALMNARGDGIERDKPFVDLANGIAAATGMADTAVSVVGDARRLPYNANDFDAAWSHGVLMFAEHDKSLNELSRVLEPGGGLYIGYTSLGHRLAALETAVRQRNRQLLWSTLVILFNDRLFRTGIHLTPRSRARCYLRTELERASELAGFEVSGAPGLQDSSQAWNGQESTIDFTAEKASDPKFRAADIVQAAPDTAAALAEAEAAFHVGAPATTLMMLDAIGADTRAGALQRLKVLSIMKAGDLRAPQAGALDDDDSPGGRLARAKIKFNFGHWADARALLDRVDQTPETSLLGIAAAIFADEAPTALSLAEEAAARWPARSDLAIAHIRALEATGDDDGLFAATDAFLKRAVDTPVSYSRDGDAGLLD